MPYFTDPFTIMGHKKDIWAEYFRRKVCSTTGIIVALACVLLIGFTLVQCTGVWMWVGR